MENRYLKSLQQYEKAALGRLLISGIRILTAGFEAIPARADVDADPLAMVTMQAGYRLM